MKDVDSFSNRPTRPFNTSMPDWSLADAILEADARPTSRVSRSLTILAGLAALALICFCAGWAARDADREKRVPEIQAERGAR